jgi:5-methylcytosine-specific restriction endonuclease McrA
MAQPWAMAFYKSKIWRQQRWFALERDHYTCVDCQGRCQEVHHKVELTPENISDPRISLSLDNLVCLCHDCHTKRHAGVGDVPDGYVFDEAGQVVPYPPG